MTVSDRPNRSGRWTKQKIQSSRYCECPGTQTTLQSLLDTTPPKRVPVLWDGPAPAPSLSEPKYLTPFVFPLFPGDSPEAISESVVQRETMCAVEIRGG